ncbi:MAG: type IV pilus twitching motility protein PilT [Thermodesulfovibrionales bacterium]|nr:type IV pilus twitching motility protein PilT [Thermodesulfovibrionales bacterium]
MDLLEILKQAVTLKASDIHIVVDKPPMFRINGRIIPMTDYPVLTSEDTKALIYSMMLQEQIAKFEEQLELDMSYYIPGLSRFRVNVLYQKNGVEAAFRIIPNRIPSPLEIGLSDAVLSLTRLPRGLILVTGPTGTGKTTSIACMLNVINSERYEHILTIEEPIEYVYEHKRCIVRQREVGLHTHSFASALKHALRQDPDIILVGEMRDLETISLALTAAETGHLVFSTLHTQDAAQTVDRIIDVFPPYQQQQVRAQLAATLKGVISQQLLPRADGRGRVAAREVMIVTPAIANLIREGKTHQLYGAIETGMKFGMHTLETSLAELVRDRLITIESAFSKANNPELLRLKLHALGIKVSEKR